MYAIFEASGKQFRAQPRGTLRVPLLDAAPGERVTFDQVLLGERDGEVVVGQPALHGAAVVAEVVRHGRHDKIVVFKRKRRKNYRRKQGHRQRFTEILVHEIDLGNGKGAKAKRSTRRAVAAVEERRQEIAEVDITEAARLLAEEHDVDFSSLEGSGKGGRILKSDIDRAIRAKEGK